jgi:hypothetical protein
MADGTLDCLTIDGLQLSICILINGDSKNKADGLSDASTLISVVSAIRFTPHILTTPYGDAGAIESVFVNPWSSSFSEYEPP